MAVAIVNQDKTEVTITVKDKDLVEFCLQHPDFNFKDILRSIPKTFANSAPPTKIDPKSLTKNIENLQNQITKIATDINNFKTNNQKINIHNYLLVNKTMLLIFLFYKI